MIAIILDSLSPEASVAQKWLLLMVKSLDALQKEYRVYDRHTDRDEFLAEYKDISCVIPLIHGGIGEWWQVTAMCEMLWLPCIFSSSDVHSFCFDKQRTNTFVQNLWYVVPQSSYFLSWDEIQIGFAWPYFVKPARNWSSLDCWRFDNIDDAKNLIQKITDYDIACVQEVIVWREMTVSLAGDRDGDIEVLWIMEILTERAFFDFDAKYKLDKTQEIFPDLSDELRKHISDMCVDIYRRVQLTDCARIDIILRWEEIVFLEINTIPGMTETSFLPKCVEKAGYRFDDFLRRLILHNEKPSP